MSNISLGPRTNLGAIGALGAGAYLAVGVIVHNTNKPFDVEVEVSATPGTVSGNKQLLVFAKQSLNGSDFTTGPESGTVSTDEQNLTLVGVLPLNTSATLQRSIFRLMPAYGGPLPHSTKIVVRNDSGSALASGSVEFSEVTATVA